MIVVARETFRTMPFENVSIVAIAVHAGPNLSIGILLWRFAPAFAATYRSSDRTS